MFKHLKFNLSVTKSYIFLRLAAYFIATLLYILAAAAIQGTVIKILGATTFNYIFAGIISLIFCIAFYHFISGFLMSFISCLTVGTVAYGDTIKAEQLSAIYVGWLAFRKNITSFGAILAIKFVIKKIGDEISPKLWDLLDNVPFLLSIRKFSDSAIATYIVNDMFNYCFESVIFYLIKYSEPGIKDDISHIMDALKSYLFALPTIMLSSSGLYAICYFIPKIIKWVLIITTLLTQGLVASILILSLIFPVFYIIKQVIFDYLIEITMLSGYEVNCCSQDSSKASSAIVDSILENIDLESISWFFKFDQNGAKSDSNETESNESEDSTIQDVKVGKDDVKGYYDVIADEPLCSETGRGDSKEYRGIEDIPFPPGSMFNSHSSSRQKIDSEDLYSSFHSSEPDISCGLDEDIDVQQVDLDGVEDLSELSHTFDNFGGITAINDILANKYKEHVGRVKVEEDPLGRNRAKSSILTELLGTSPNDHFLDQALSDVEGNYGIDDTEDGEDSEDIEDFMGSGSLDEDNTSFFPNPDDLGIY